MVREWILDCEYYMVDGAIWLKEVCILPLKMPEDKENFDDRICYNYFIKSKGLIFSDDYATYLHQRKRHGLKVEFGDYFFDEALRNIQATVGDDKVFVKGREKCNFLKLYLNVHELPESLCSFKKVLGYHDKCCKVKHSNQFCAQRKAHILRDVFQKMRDEKD
jgi:hypothetical protein